MLFASDALLSPQVPSVGTRNAFAAAVFHSSRCLPLFLPFLFPSRCRLKHHFVHTCFERHAIAPFMPVMPFPPAPVTPAALRRRFMFTRSHGAPVLIVCALRLMMSAAASNDSLPAFFHATATPTATPARAKTDSRDSRDITPAPPVGNRVQRTGARCLPPDAAFFRRRCRSFFSRYFRPTRDAHGRQKAGRHSLRCVRDRELSLPATMTERVILQG